MRILVLTDHYPPHFVGGYEIICQDVVDALKARGHTVLVITSTFGDTRGPAETGVERTLMYCEPGGNPPTQSLIRRARWEWNENARFCRRVATFRPDVVFVWHIGNVLRSLLLTLQASGLPVAYYVSDYWLEAYRTPNGDRWFGWWAHRSANPVKQMAKRMLRTVVATGLPTSLPPLRLGGAMFCSRALRQHHVAAGFPVEGAAIIHPGIRTAAFPHTGRRDPGRQRLLYAGRLVPEKGVHTAIETVRALVREFDRPAVRLTIVGDLRLAPPPYLADLRERVQREGLEHHVRFAGRVARDGMAGVYAAHDILLFPSIWGEPFSVTLLEAMASGLAVIATATGGSPELLRDGANGLLVRAQDSAGMAAAADRLFRDSALYQGLSHEAARTVHDNLDISQMANAVEGRLQQIATACHVPRGGQGVRCVS